MLKQFRNQKRLLSVFLWLVIAAFIGTIFLVWGVGSRNQSSNNYALKVNEYKVSYEEYQNSYQNTVDTLRQLFGNQSKQMPSNEEIQKQVITELKNKYLLLGQANKLNIPVSDTEVMNELTNISSFLQNGQFSPERYTNILRANGLTPAAFEQSLKEDIKISKLRNMIRNSTRVTPSEIKKEYTYRNTEAKIRYIPFSPSSFKDNVNIKDEDLRAYFVENKENYRIPEEIKLKYIEFNPRDFDFKTNITQQEMESYYFQNKSEFSQPEKVRASHILIRVKDFDNETEVKNARNKIENILAQLKKGKDFSEMAKKYSEDASAQNGGDLGYFKKGEMIKEFENTAFSLETGKISGIVKTPFGFHIIKVTDHQKAKELTFQEAKDSIAEKLKKRNKEQYFNDRVFNIYSKILKASNISAYQSKNDNITVHTTKYFNTYENVYPLEGKPDVKRQLFNLPEAEVSNVIDIGDKKYVFEVADRKDSYVPEFSKIEEKVRQDYIQEQSIQKARNYAEKLLKENKNIESISDSVNKNYTTTPFFKRAESIPGIGINSKLTDNIFAAEMGSTLDKPYTVNSKVYLVELADIKTPDFPAEKDHPDIRNFIANIKSEAALNSYISKLESKAEIWVAPSLRDYIGN